MANHAYTMPGTRPAVLTLARLRGEALTALGAASLCMIALACFLHPEHLQAPSGPQTHHIRPRHKPAALYMACLLPSPEVAA
ncbi:MAG: hypothetical protein LKJ54_01635 [Acetobacter peroxydans]|jgi:hypothetical protein|nr:hypothetical protein [Acetobacter peroxydans]MCI2078135.1 hypothetical protein [Acetobacter peroxydans]